MSSQHFWWVATAVTVIVVQACVIVRLLAIRPARRRARSLLEERLRFETLLADLTSGLVHVPADRIEAALERGLQDVVTFLGADHGVLERYPEGRPVLRISLPPHHDRPGLQSIVSFPLRAGGPTLGVLTFESGRAHRAWPDEVVDRLRLLSEAFASALERQRVEVSLAERLAFETLLSSLWSAFSTLPLAGDFDREVQEALHRIVAFLDVDRGRLLEFTRADATVQAWTTHGGPGLGDFPWTIARVRQGDVVSFSRIEELPDAAAVDRATCDAAGITSQIAMPLAVGGAVVGALVLSTTKVERAWQADGGNQGLQLLGEVFAYALSRKQVEQEAQRLRQELAHVGRVSAMGELTASLAHELNQPLTAILNNAEVARRFLAAEQIDLAEMRAILDDIIADDKRAAEVIQRFRRLLKKGDIEYVSLDLNVLVSEVGRLLIGNAVIRGISMRLDLAPDLPRVRGDRGQLQQVVLNLVLNAFDAMSGAAADGGAHSLTIRTHCDGAHVIVEVRDSGTGIAEKDVDQIFEPLYTTKSGGLGMGLAIARTIVDAHGGRLGTANNPDGGATFHFSLPVRQSAQR